MSRSADRQIGHRDVDASCLAMELGSWRTTRDSWSSTALDLQPWESERKAQDFSVGIVEDSASVSEER